jgi:hypothetical protein
MNLRRKENEPKRASSTCPAAATAGRKTSSSPLFKEFLWQIHTQLFHPHPAGREQAATTRVQETVSSPTHAHKALNGSPTLTIPTSLSSFISLQGGFGMKSIL